MSKLRHCEPCAAVGVVFTVRKSVFCVYFQYVGVMLSLMSCELFHMIFLIVLMHICWT